MKEYEHLKLEKKWQAYWEKNKIFQAQEKSKKPKFYGLIEFPYPSGSGLHVGHIRSNTAMDIISRKRRMEGHNVLYPIGWDAFGLPTENYAIKTGIHPIKVTKDNTDTFRRQLKALGFSFDWSREVNTTDPKYYKWTQWIFLQFWKQGLAYKTKTEINWCPSCKIGLANEEVVGGMCDRCGGPTEKREKEQWMLAITKYAERLDRDLDLVNYLPKIKIQQRNWIGKSEGAEIDFKIKTTRQDLVEKIKVFTTRPDTIFGATYLVLSPEHSIVEKITTIDQKNNVTTYVIKSKAKPEFERTSAEKEKTGVFTGAYAVNPATKEEIPIWIADYVLAHYGTGAIMAVPAHDERDNEFAEKYKLPIKQVVLPPVIIPGDLIGPYGVPKEDTRLVGCWTGEGKLTNSEQFNGMDSEKAKKEITAFVGGKIVTKFKLRDWVFSRQRYWGEPIPLINCGKCGFVPVPERDLPILLPRVAKYKPTDDGESPLAGIKSWVNIKCPKCRGKAKRETDTMPNWAGSSWYFLRYVDPKNSKAFAGAKSLKYWLGSLGVDWYNGGMEHTTLHLLYSRFWHKFLYDLKLVPTSEPYIKRTSHGMILGEGGVKMSKSLGNVVNPDQLVKTYGADTLRLYEMFMGPFDQSVAWSGDSLIGPRRFLEKVWRIRDGLSTRSHDSVSRLLHKTIKKVSEDIEGMHFNTAISTLMIFATEMQNTGSVSKKDFQIFLQILSPFAPHISEELWSVLGEKKSISLSRWPKWDEKWIADEEMKIAVQVNGRVRAEMIIRAEDSQEKIKEQALGHETVAKHISGQSIKKVIYVPGRLINIVV
ncbi:MAG: leucine--tRNA ligase [bacterium]|nr:leucine--tRNA ligase [bacterium]